jgi:hypothetical protein
MGLAIEASNWTMAGASTPLSALAANANWNSVVEGIPDLTAPPTGMQSQKTLQNLEAYAPNGTPYTGNTIIVGSIKPPLLAAGIPFPPLTNWLTGDWDIGGQTQSAFSNTFGLGDPGLFAVGDQVLVNCNQNGNPQAPACATPKYDSGTSYATPQVAGLAALLWGVDARIAGQIGVTPLYQSPASVTVNLINATAAVGPSGGNAKTLDALAALLSLDLPMQVGPATAPIRLGLLDFNSDGVFDANDVQAFVNVYFANPTNPGAISGTPLIIDAMNPSAPDFMKYDLNGDGFTGLYAHTSFDLDPTGSTLRGAPQLGNAVYTLPAPPVGSGQTVTLDENQVTDLDVMCFYAYSPLFSGPASDPTGSIRAQLGCGTQVLARTGVDTAPGYSGPFTSFDTKVSVNNLGEVAFSGADATGQNAGFIANGPSLIQPVTFAGATNRSFAGASINDASPTPMAAFLDRVSGSPPIYYARSWLTDGSAASMSNSTVVGVGNSGNANQHYCQSGSNAGLTCSFGINVCPNFNSSGIQTGNAPCVAPPDGGYISSSSFVDINDSGLVAFPVLDNNFNEQLWAGHNLSDLAPLTNYPSSGTLILRPQVANTNEIVYRDVSGNIQVTTFPTGATSQVSACSQQTQRPGISRDGNFVAFAATCSGQSAIWIAANNGSGWKTLGPVALVGALASPSAGYASAPVFSQFNLTTRVGVASVQRADASFALEVVFGGTGATALTAAADGVYKVSATVDPTLSTLTVPYAPRKIIAVNDTLYGQTVTQYDLWDPVSPSGVWVAMALTFAGTNSPQAIVRALVP